MEPLHPDLRKELKEVHPGLTDEDIDRAEELLAQRMLHDPEKEQERIMQLDQDRMDLIEQKMPHYNEVVRAFKERRVNSQEKPPKKVNVTRKKPRSGEKKR